MMPIMMWVRPWKQRLMRVAAAGLVLVALSACNGGVQEDYYDDDEGSPSQGAPLDAGEQDIEDAEEAE